MVVEDKILTSFAKIGEYMEPISILLALVGIGLGYGASTTLTKRKLGDAEERADKELKKARKEAEKQLADARGGRAGDAEVRDRDRSSGRHGDGTAAGGIAGVSRVAGGEPRQLHHQVNKKRARGLSAAGP